MDELILGSLQGRLTPEEEERVHRWRAEAADNERRYRQLAAVWTLVGVADPVEANEPVPDMDVLLTAGSPEATASGGRPEAQQAGGTSAESRARGLRIGPWVRHLGGGIAAAALLAVGFGIGQLVMEMPPDRSPLAQSQIVTGAGEMATVTLGDGSSIRLGPRSRVVLEEREGATVAHLEGRAFFGVHPAREHEFRVRTRHGEAKVVGTRFEVRSEEEEFRVLVVEGHVTAYSGGAEVGLSEGEMARSSAGGPPTTTRVEDVHEHLGWMGNALVFQGTPLYRVAQEIERRYGVRISIEEALFQVTVTVTFTDEALEDVVFVLCEIIAAHCVVDPGRVDIRKGNLGTPGIRSGNVDSHTIRR